MEKRVVYYKKGDDVGAGRKGACQTSETKLDAKNPRWLLRVYASAVVGRTLTNSVLVSRDLTDESAGSSEKHRH